MFDLTTWLIIALVTSLIANCVAFWYIRQVLSKLLFVSQNLSDLADLIINYRNHMKTVYELETYYGDETMKHLLDHTGSLLKVLEEYEDVYSIAIPIDEDEFSEQEEQGEQIDAAPQIKEENVFYGGSRKSNN